MEPIAEISPEEAKQDKPVLRYPELSPEQQSVLNVLIQRLEQIGTANEVLSVLGEKKVYTGFSTREIIALQQGYSVLAEQNLPEDAELVVALQKMLDQINS